MGAYTHKRFNKVLAAVIAMSLGTSYMMSGCSAADIEKLQQKVKNSEEENKRRIKANETVSDESKWINSAIEGAIDENLKVRPQDDFFTAVNREYELEAKLENDQLSQSHFVNSLDAVRENKKTLVSGDENALLKAKKEGTAPLGLNYRQTAHNAELVRKYAELAGDWKKREEDGVEPLRPYLSRIEEIHSLQEFTDYLLDGYNGKFEFLSLVNFYVDAPIQSGKKYNAVILDETFPLIMQSAADYSSIPSNELTRNYAVREMLENVLEPLGYDKAETERLWRSCMRFEVKAARFIELYAVSDTLSYYSEADKTSYTMEDIEKMQSQYPMTEILRRNGMGDAGEYRIYFPKCFKGICSLYNENNLEDLKSFYIVHTALDAMKFLRKSDVEAIQTMVKDVNSSDTTEQAFEAAETDEDLLYNVYFPLYFEEPLDEYYSAYFSTEEEKAELLMLTENAISAYQDIIRTEDWLSEETKEECIDKLQKMQKNILYPDEFTDYQDLDLTDCENLLEAIRKIDAYNLELMRRRLAAPYSRGQWQLMGPFSTTEINATYNPTENSMNIYAGIIAGGEIFDVNAAKEKNMAKIGTIIGHEISHSLDPMGRTYNEVGDYVSSSSTEEQEGTSWWTKEDEEIYDKKVDKLVKYFSVLPNYRNSIYPQLGFNIKGEAIADVTGMKTMLKLAEEEKDFDYRSFFESYAEFWREKVTVEYVDAVAMSDVHPLNFKRVNVTVQQFDEFYESFDVKEGDGMYLPEEKRLNVW